MNFPNELTLVHPVFHVSMIKTCIGDLVSILLLERLGFDENVFIPVEILESQLKRLRNKEVAYIKVVWRNYLVEDATWELFLSSSFPS